MAQQQFYAADKGAAADLQGVDAAIGKFVIGEINQQFATPVQRRLHGFAVHAENAAVVFINAQLVHQLAAEQQRWGSGAFFRLQGLAGWGVGE